jgi:hypothetical protein
VNDDEEEKHWAEVMNLMIDGSFTEEEWAKAFDDITGKELDVEEVREARKDEMGFVKGIKVYEEAPIEECIHRTGKKPIGTRWVDILKGEITRSRWVAQDFKKKGDNDREDLFAAMPPLEAKKALFRLAAVKMTGKSTMRGEPMKLMMVDIRKAHLNARCNRDDVYVALPIEAQAMPGMCGRLLRWLYGMRGAAQGWEKEFGEKLESVGFTKGKSSPVVFHRESDETVLVVHGDDFTFLGYPDVLDELLTDMRSWWDIKLRGIIGSEAEDTKEITILNRTLTWDGSELTLKADQKHRDEIIKAFGLIDGSRGITIPVDKEATAEVGDDEPLTGEDVTRFRGLAARANYLGLDRCDIQFATKEICRCMSKPTKGGMTKMKRLARYLLETPVGIMRYSAARDDLERILVYVDSDWAGCKSTRKSTSGGAITWGGGLLKSWSRTQGCVSLSSGEAEFYAAIKGGAEGIGVRSLLADMGQEVKVEIHQDSTAAKGMASRLGVGKVKHLDVGWLWIQEAVRKGDLVLEKICGKINPADMLTKPKSVAEMIRLTDALWYDIKVRRQRAEDERRDGGFTGFVRRMLRGADKDGDDRAETMLWWKINMEVAWKEGTITG